MRFIAILCSVATVSTAYATSLTMDINGVKYEYVLKSAYVDSNGNVSITAVTPTTTVQPPVVQPPVTPPVVRPPVTPPVTPPVVQPPVSTDCISSNTLTCVTTPLSQGAQRRLSYRPNPSMVYAFKVTTPATGTYFNRVIATGMTGAKSSKLLVVSKTPGDVSTADKDMGCYRQATESTSVQLVVNNPAANKYLNCHLDPNSVYYINAVSTDLSGNPTCSSASNCGFYFEGS